MQRGPSEPVNPPDDKRIPFLCRSERRQQAGRCVLAPDAPWSSSTLSQPARLSASSWRSRFCSSVETRAYPIFMAGIMRVPFRAVQLL